LQVCQLNEDNGSVGVDLRDLVKRTKSNPVTP
jgi:hypothetical protein